MFNIPIPVDTWPGQEISFRKSDFSEAITSSQLSKAIAKSSQTAFVGFWSNFSLVFFSEIS